jgi:hypothetical protein
LVVWHYKSSKDFHSAKTFATIFDLTSQFLVGYLFQDGQLWAADFAPAAVDVALHVVEIFVRQRANVWPDRDAKPIPFRLPAQRAQHIGLRFQAD